jgi:hypothetical protein
MFFGLFRQKIIMMNFVEVSGITNIVMVKELLLFMIMITAPYLNPCNLVLHLLLFMFFQLSFVFYQVLNNFIGAFIIIT